MYKYPEEIIKSYNKLAIEQLKLQNYQNSIIYLKQALLVIKRVNQESVKYNLMALTFTNLGCFFKKTEKNQEALEYFLKAVSLDNKINSEFGSISGAYLNICSILSEQGKHKEALDNALKGINFLKKNWNNTPELITNLVLSYHAAGIEYQHLNLFEESEQTFRKGWDISQNYFGIKNSLTLTLKNCIKLYKNKNSAKILHKTHNCLQEKLITRPKSQNPCQRIRKTQKYKNISRFINPNFIISPQIEIFYDDSLSNSPEITPKLAKLPKKIDINKHKAIEKQAAIMIQSWWRGISARKKYEDLLINIKIKKAENNARKAVEHYERLKRILKIKKNSEYK